MGRHECALRFVRQELRNDGVNNQISSPKAYLEGVAEYQHGSELNRPSLWTRIYIELAAIRGYAGHLHVDSALLHLR